MIFLWNQWNVDHIGEHQVTPEEAEFVVRRAAAPFPRAIGGGKFLVWGQTRQGRYLQVIYVYPPDEKIDIELLSPPERLAFEEGDEVLFVIHAMELDADKKRKYRTLKGRRG